MKTGIIAWIIRKAFYAVEDVLCRTWYLPHTQAIILQESADAVLRLEDELKELNGELRRQNEINAELENGRA